jgi:GDP-L-fucose synthase
VAKIAGIEMCQAYNRQFGTRFVSVMPTNLYGPGDSFDLENSHVLPALMRKFHEAKVRGDAEVEVWGTGTARREFLHVDDMADACVYLMERYDGSEIVNIGCGADIEIGEVARIIKRVVRFEGRIRQDTSKPDGTPRKLLDISRLASMGWSARTPLEAGLVETYAWFREVFEPESDISSKDQSSGSIPSRTRTPRMGANQAAGVRAVPAGSVRIGGVS